MSLKEKINNDIKAAMLGGNRFEADVLRNFKAVMLNEEVAKGKRETGLDDSEVEQLIAREIKKRSESSEAYLAAGRAELAKTEKAESEVLARYMPSLISDDEIKKAIADYKLESGSDNMGQIIGFVKNKYGSRADGATIARLVKESL